MDQESANQGINTKQAQVSVGKGTIINSIIWVFHNAGAMLFV
jgi:hypothetical protein